MNLIRFFITKGFVNVGLHVTVFQIFMLIVRADHTDDVLAAMGFRVYEGSADDSDSQTSSVTMNLGNARNDEIFVSDSQRQPRNDEFAGDDGGQQQNFAPQTADVSPFSDVGSFRSDFAQPVLYTDIPLEVEFKQMEQKMREKQQQPPLLRPASDSESLAEVIRPSAVDKIDLIRAEQPQNGQSQQPKIEFVSGGGVSNADLINTSKPGKIFDIVFSRDFRLFDPRNASSRFEFDDIAAEQNIGKEQTAEFTPALDNVAFLRQKPINNVNNGGDLVNMVSVPFSRWLPQRAGIPAILSGYEATVETKQPLSVESGQVLSVALLFNCRTINTKLHRFPPGAVLDAHDDQRLGRCGFSLAATSDPTGLEFGIVATNKGIWATYSNPLLTRYELKLNYEAFTIYRRLADRGDNQLIASSLNNPLIDARIEVDRQANNGVGETRYFLNNQLMWKVGQWGVLTQEIRDDPRNRLVSFSPGGAPPVVPSSFALYLANTHIMDVGDALLPAPGATNFALVKYANLPGYYPNNVNFADSSSNRNSSLYGQGAIMGLKRLVVVRSGEAVNKLQQQVSVRNEAASSPNRQEISDRVGSLVDQSPPISVPSFQQQQQQQQQQRQQNLVGSRRPCFNGNCFRFPSSEPFPALLARRRRGMMGSLVYMFAL